MGKLIDVQQIIKQLSEDIYNQTVSDYDNGYATGVTSAIIKLEEAPNIDPVHTAGGVYCYECKYHEDEVYPDGNWEVHDHQECWCNWWDNIMPLNGFCSEGKVREDNG